jgi:hypothetical protein
MPAITRSRENMNIFQVSSIVAVCLNFASILVLSKSNVGVELTVIAISKNHL